MQAADAREKFFDAHTLVMTLVGTTGELASSFDLWITRAIALLTLAILAHRAYVVFFRKRDRE